MTLESLIFMKNGVKVTDATISPSTSTPPLTNNGSTNGDSEPVVLSLQVLDQLLIPDEKKYIDVPNIQTTWAVIKNMQIRGTFCCLLQK